MSQKSQPNANIPKAKEHNLLRFIVVVILIFITILGSNSIYKYYTTIPSECSFSDDTVKYGPIKVGTEVILGRHRPVNETGTWIVVMTRWSEKDEASQSYKVSDEFPIDYITEKTEEGYFIYLIDYANGKWIIVMNYIDDYSTEWDWTLSSEFPESYIDNKWDDDFDITDIEYGGGNWAIVMGENRYPGQSYRRRSSFTEIEEFIYDKQIENYFITDIEYGDGTWVSLASKLSSSRGQSWEIKGEFPEDYIEQQEQSGYYLYDIERANGTWLVYTTRTNFIVDQIILYSDVFPSDKIDEKWDDNFYITNVSYGPIGSDTWAYEKNNYIGARATVTKLDGVDSSGCPIVRVNIDSEHWRWRVRDLEIVPNDYSTKTYVPSDYSENNANASPGEETSVSLDDGARITILSNSIIEDVEVRIERNPAKTNDLPSLGSDVTQLSDFYNFEIDEGSLIGPVEIRIPFDEELIPNESGLLTIGIPTENGWQFIPVSSYDGYVTFKTMNLGDPLIAWHFVDMDRINLEYEGKQFCQWTIPTKIRPYEGNWDTTFKLSGQVIPNSEFDTDVSNIALVIKANYWRDPSGGTFYTTTDEDGHFEIEIDPLGNDFFTFIEGLNGFHILAGCDSPKGSFSSTSEGWITFEINGDKPSQNSSESSSNSSSGNSGNQTPTLYLDKNYFCRTGPNQAFPDVTAFVAGTSLPIIGKTDGWWLVAINESHTTKKSCWIGGGTASGDTSRVTYYEPPSISGGSVPLYDQQGRFIQFYECQKAQANGLDQNNGWYLIKFFVLGDNKPDTYFSQSDYQKNCPGYPSP